MNSIPKKLKSYKLQAGFSLVEILVAISIFLVFVTAIGSLTVSSGYQLKNSVNRERATALAEEAFEASRNIRDADFANLIDGTHGLTTTGNQWNFSSSSDTTGVFTRQLAISTIHANQKKLDATVSWADKISLTNSVTLTTYLTNWLSIFIQPPGTRLAYYDFFNQNLKYAACDNNCSVASNWTTVAIDTTGNVGQHTSLAMDGSKPRISYLDVSNKNLKYASCDSNCTLASSWTLIVVDAAGSQGQYSSLVFDSTGRPRVAYFNIGNKDLKYASCNTTCTVAANWTITSVDIGGTVGQYSSLVLDSLNRPRIAYYDATNKNLKYTSCDTNCTVASNWTRITVDSLVADTGRYASLILYNDKPRIAYYDLSNKDAKFASCDSNCTVASNWTRITVDSLNDVGSYSSLAMNVGKPRIVYYDVNNKNLKYASCDANCTVALNWSTFVIDSSSSNIGQYASLAIDTDKSRVTSFDLANGKLRYSSCESGCTSASNWKGVLIDTSSKTVGQYNSFNK